jgi:two-component system, chemotaxis family, protein-glutamate methylesterase/glutaminase
VRAIRVLVVDDSVVVRKLLTSILSADPLVEVVGTAPNGAIALAKLSQLNPDVVTLDVEMPDMDGLETLVGLRKLYPRLPVIMFSSLTERAATTTLEALGRGATDYVTKPNGVGSLDAAIDHVRSQLLPKVRTLGTAQIGGETPSAPSYRLPARSPGAPAGGTVDILAVGASTGGPNALAELFRAFPASFPLPIVVVQHMPPLFTKLFAERLTASGKLPFHEAVHGEPLLPGHAYVAPGDFHMRVIRDKAGLRLALDQAPQENSCRPAVDVLFRSVADVFGRRVLAAVLTGMGQDGLKGCELLRTKGAQIVVQDEASSVVWGMPGFVARAGLAEAVLPLAELAPELLRRCRPSTLSPHAEGGTHHVA